MNNRLILVFLGFLIPFFAACGGSAASGVARVGSQSLDEAFRLFVQSSDDVARQAQYYDEILRHLDEGAYVLRSADELAESTSALDELTRFRNQVIATEGQLKIRPASQNMDETLNMLQEIRRNLSRSQAENAIAVASYRSQSESLLLGELSEDEVFKLYKSFLCLHIGTLANYGVLPTEEDYANFAFQQMVGKIFSGNSYLVAQELVEKGQNIIDFAEGLQADPSAYDEIDYLNLAVCQLPS